MSGDKKKILIIQTAFIGDVILTLPMVQVLKKNYADSAIDFLLIPSASSVLKNNPYINDLIIYDKHGEGKGIQKLNKILKLVRQNNYDIVISPHRSARSAMIAFFSGAKQTITFNTSSMSFLYSDKVEYQKSLHEIQRNLALLQPLNITENKIIRPELFPGKEEKQKIDSLLNRYAVTPHDRIISIAPGSVWFTKRYPEEKFLNLISLLQNQHAHIFLIGGAKDGETGKYIQSKTSHTLLHNTIGELSVLQSAELISRSEVLITNDSAPLHIANAVGTRVIAIFGATIPEFGFYPYGQTDKTFQTLGLKCRPCGIHGGDKCPIGTFECMQMIKEEDIVKEVYFPPLLTKERG